MAEQLELDCYHKAEPGEPKFTLIGRDRLGPGLVRLWAALREGNAFEASRQFANLTDIAEVTYPKPNDETKVASACDIAGQMEQWRG